MRFSVVIVVTQLYFERALLAEGWRRDVLITLTGSTIFAVEADVSAPPDAIRIGGIAVPGIPNVHSHAFQRAIAGLAERRGPEADNFWTWRQAMYHFLAQMTPDDIEAVTALAYVEMLEAGFTRVGEFHYLHNAPDGCRYADRAELAGRIVAAALQSGIGLTLLPCFYAHGGCGGKPALPAQARFLTDLDGFADLLEASARHLRSLDGARLGIAPHSLRAVDAKELSELVGMYSSGPIHMHAAEQALEVTECLAWSGARPVEWLLDNMPVDARWCLIHCTHMTQTETLRLARSGAVVGLCPVTEANLGDGIFPAVAYEQAGGSYAIGTDSNVRIAANEELRSLEYSQRLRDERRNRLGATGASTGRALLEAVCAGGVRALGLAPVGTGLAAGQRGDIVVLDRSHPALVGRSDDATLDSWIFAAGPAVSDVFASGRHVVVRGRHTRADAVRSRYAETANRLLQKL
jgi:formiminoglutamate deiminase